MSNIGYARVSTREQNLDMQITALRKAGCEKIFSEKVSGVKERPVLKECLSYLREGDTLVVYKFDRIGRSLKRTKDGREEARRQGRSLGKRKGAGIKQDKVDACAALYRQGLAIDVIMQQLGIKSKSTVYRYLRMRRLEPCRKL